MLGLGQWFYLKTRVEEDPLPCSLTWLLAGGIGALSHEPLYRVAHDVATGFPQSDQWKESERE